MDKPQKSEPSSGEEPNAHYRDRGITYDSVIRAIKLGISASDIQDHDKMTEQVHKLKTGENITLRSVSGQRLSVEKIAEDSYDIEFFPSNT